MSFHNVSHLPRYPFFTEFTPTIPKFYWDVYSQEERIKAICLEIHKIIKYCEEIGMQVNADSEAVEALAQQIADFEEDFDDHFEAYFDERVTEWLSEYLTDTVLNRLLQTQYYETVTAMLASDTLIVPCLCYCGGYYALNDGGEGMWRIQSMSLPPDNGMDRRRVTGTPNMIAIRINSDSAHPEQFGYSYTHGVGYEGKSLTRIIERMHALNLKINGLNHEYYIDEPVSLNTYAGFYMYGMQFFTIPNPQTGTAPNCFFNRNTYTSQIMIDNCTFTGFNTRVSNGFSLDAALPLSAVHISVTNTGVYQNDGNGIMLYHNPNIDSSEFENVLIKNCVAYENGVPGTSTGIGIGAYLDPSNSYMNVTIDGCVAYENANSGIAPHGCNNVKIVNCNSYDNGEHGYVVQDSIGASIANCNAKGNSANSIRIQGNWLNANSYCYDVTITGCNLMTKGILCGHGVHNAVITGNTFTDLTNVTQYAPVLIFDHPEKPCSDVLFTNNVIVKATGTTPEICSSQPGNTNIISTNNMFNGKNSEFGGTLISTSDRTKRYISNSKFESIAGKPNDVVLTQFPAGSMSGDILTSTNGGICAQSDNQVIPFTDGMKYIVYYVKLTYSDVTDKFFTPVIRLRNSGGGLVSDMQNHQSAYNIGRAGTVEMSVILNVELLKSEYPAADRIQFALHASDAGAKVQVNEYCYSWNGYL